MKLRKLLAFALVVVMIFALAASCEKKIDTNTKNPRDTLVVGTPEMNGDFIGGFGNSSYDLYIKTLTGGYADTYYQTAEGKLEMNPSIVKKEEISYDDAGNKTYTFTLHEDIKWSDGTTITAKEYVAAILMAASPAWVSVGASTSMGEGIVGYSAYYSGETNVFEGVKLLGDYQFSMEIDVAELPYFYETAYVAAGPVCMATYFPAIDVVSDDNGASFTGDILADCQRIAETERFKPDVVCGPYKFVSFENQTVTLERNDFFKGDWNGDKPKFKYIIQKAVNQDTNVDQILSGDIDLYCGVIEGAKIEKAKADPYGTMNEYLRAGYGMLAMACDWGVTADPNVRWAIGLLIDRTAVIDYVLEGYGGTVDGCYGMAQWTFEAKEKELKEQMIPISFNLEEANEYLDKSEWKFEKDGKTPFDSTKAAADGSYMRYNANGELLTVNHLGTSENDVTDIIEIQYTKNAPLAGMKFNVTKGDFNMLLDNYYYGYDLGADRYFNTFNLASNFTAVDDKYMSWHSDWLGSWYNSNQLSDPEIDRLTMEMRRLDPSQDKEYANLWLQFQVRWQQLLPNLPLYSNQYFDIFNSVLKSCPTSPYANYCDVICQMEKYS